VQKYNDALEEEMAQRKDLRKAKKKEEQKEGESNDDLLEEDNQDDDEQKEGSNAYLMQQLESKDQQLEGLKKNTDQFGKSIYLTMYNLLFINS